MKTVLYDNFSGDLPIKLWLDPKDIEQECLDQVRNLSKLPFAFHHVALMPDGHTGYGMPIGGVLATNNAVIPNAVGVDIGCGVRACRTTLSEISIHDLKRIMSRIRAVIPVGFGKHTSPQTLPDNLDGVKSGNASVVNRNQENAASQLGTLGGGNHFIEIQKGSDNKIWIMLHSGSRNLGKKVADFYNEIAVQQNGKYYSKVPKEYGLAFLPIDTTYGMNYLAEMSYCVKYAEANRALMMQRSKEAFLDVIPNTDFDTEIDVPHNYAVLEHHFGKNVYIHRKGATRAQEGDVDLIPGSQGTASYVVRGKGNPDSFMSCSHGAGRKMSRTKARANLDLTSQARFLDEQGIIHALRTQNDLDEAPGAYKDISEVMANQSDLVYIVTELKPLAVIKG